MSIEPVKPPYLRKLQVVDIELRTSRTVHVEVLNFFAHKIKTQQC